MGTEKAPRCFRDFVDPLWILSKLHNQELFKNRKCLHDSSRCQRGTSGEDGDLKTWKDGKPLNVMEHEQKLRKDKDFLLIIAYLPLG